MCEYWLTLQLSIATMWQLFSHERKTDYDFKSSIWIMNNGWWSSVIFLTEIVVNNFFSHSTRGSLYLFQHNWHMLDCSLFCLKPISFCYSVFKGFSKARSANGGSILSSSQLPQKMKLASKVVKVDSKIIILLPKI